MKVVFHLETASSVYLFETSHSEPRRIHLFRLLLLIPAEAVAERYGEAAGVVLYPHIEVLGAVARLDVEVVHPVEEVGAFQLEHRFVAGEGVAQGGVHIAHGTEAVTALYGSCLPEGGDFQTDIGAAAQGEGVGPLPDACPLLVVEGGIVVAARLVVLQLGVQRQLAVPPRAYAEGDHGGEREQLQVVPVLVIINGTQLVRVHSIT